MMNLNYIRDCYGNNITSERLLPHSCEKYKEIELLDRQSVLLAEWIYIGTQSKVDEIIRSGLSVEDGALLVTADAFKPLSDKLIGFDNINIIETSLSLAECFNLVNGLMSRHRRWSSELTAMRCAGSPQTIIEYLAKESGASVFLIDADGFVLAGSNSLPKKVPTFRSLLGDGHMAAGLLNSIKNEGESIDGLNRLSYPNFELTIYSRSLFFDDKQLIIIFAFYKLLTSLDIVPLLNYSEEALRLSLKSQQSGDLSKEDLDFKSLWKEMVEKKFNSSAEIRNELNNFLVKPQLFARIIVIRSEKNGAVMDAMISELHIIFPQSHISAEESEVIVLLHHPKRLFNLGIESDLRLKAFLEKYDAYLGHSGATRDYCMLPTLYEIAKQVLTLGRQLGLEPKERIFTTERYSVFCMIELCAQRFCSIHGTNNIVFLSHPAIIHLTRHDHHHNNNLRDVLYVYLMNDCSISKTAAITFMHRNTIFNKLKKIEEIIKINFEDGSIRQQLLYSCQLIFYYERVMNQRLNLDMGKDE
jgi:sugar diacid utilization regulator